MGRCEARLAFVRPACGHPSRPQPLPAPPTPTPAAGERRPGGRCGLGRERHKVSGGRARRVPRCGVRGGTPASSPDVSGTVLPAGRDGSGGVRWPGGCVAGPRGRAPSGRRAIPEQVPPHLEPSSQQLEALGAAGPTQEPAPGGEEQAFWGGPGVWDRLDPVVPAKGPRSVLAGFPPSRRCSRSLSSLPLPTLCQVISSVSSW